MVWAPALESGLVCIQDILEGLYIRTHLLAGSVERGRGDARFVHGAEHTFFARVRVVRPDTLGVARLALYAACPGMLVFIVRLMRKVTIAGVHRVCRVSL